MEAFIEAIRYKNEHNMTQYKNKLNESLKLNYSLAYHEIAKIYSYEDINKAIEYLSIANNLATDVDIQLAEYIGITIVDNLELHMNSIHI